MSAEDTLVCAMRRRLAYAHMGDGYRPLPHRRLLDFQAGLKGCDCAGQWEELSVLIVATVYRS